jgi:hypothetical protein
MAFLRTLDHFFGSLALARKYEQLFSMGAPNSPRAV